MTRNLRKTCPSYLCLNELTKSCGSLANVGAGMAQVFTGKVIRPEAFARCNPTIVLKEESFIQAVLPGQTLCQAHR